MIDSVLGLGCLLGGLFFLSTNLLGLDGLLLIVGVVLSLVGAHVLLVAALPVRTSDHRSLGGGLIFLRVPLNADELALREVAEAHATARGRRGRLVLTTARLIYVPARSFVFGTDPVDAVDLDRISSVTVSGRGDAYSALRLPNAVVIHALGSHRFYPTGGLAGGYSSDDLADDVRAAVIDSKNA